MQCRDLDEQERRNAIRHVCAAALDPEDAKVLLAMLGLSPQS